MGKNVDLTPQYTRCVQELLTFNSAIVRRPRDVQVIYENDTRLLQSNSGDFRSAHSKGKHKDESPGQRLAITLRFLARMYFLAFCIYEEQSQIFRN